MTELLGDRIKRLRTARRMSKTALGKAMGLSRVAITKWENGDTKNLRNDNLVRLAHVFEITLEELLTGTAPLVKYGSQPPLKAAEPQPEQATSLPPLIQRIAEDLMHLDPEKLLEIKHWSSIERVFAEKRRQLAEQRKEQAT